MTFAEAKDQVAKTIPKPDSQYVKYKSYDDMCEWVREGWANPNVIIECTDKAAELYAESVMEESWKDGYDSGMSFQYNHGDSYTADEAWAICNPTSESPSPQ